MSSLISVKLPASTYNIVISSNILTSIGKHLKLLNVGKKILIVSNPIVFANYGQITLASLKREKFRVKKISSTTGIPYFRYDPKYLLLIM